MKVQTLRRYRLLHLLCILAVVLIASVAYADETTVVMKTYTYKTVGDLDIQADVYRSNDSTLRPVVISIHGGALIFGHREWIDARLKELLLDAGYIIVSIDYRLAPETLLPGIIEDIEDAFAWVRTQGPGLFHADTSKIAVIGSSAGGCLTLASGYRVKPRPDVLVSLFGYGDLIGDWYSTPSPHKRHQGVEMSADEAKAVMRGPAVADSRKREGDGRDFYIHCRQKGIWPKAVTGWDPRKEAEKFYPYMTLKNIDGNYPPAFLIHGTEDTDVPYEMSALMAQELKANDVEYRFFTIEGGEHGLKGGDPEQIEAAYQAAFSFIEKHMQK